MIEELRSLKDADLREVAQALRSGRLFAPFTPASLQRYCGPGTAPLLAQSMQRRAEEGMRPEHLALVFEACLSARPGAGKQDAVELVWTGPELPCLSNRDTAVVVRELFAAASGEVLVSGYAVHQGREVFRTLAERMDRGPDLRVRMYLDVQRPHGDTSLDSEVLSRFAHRFRDQEWPGKRLPEVWYDPRSVSAERAKRSSLHAKCLVIDRRVAFVSSANFTEAAQARNIEVGALVHDEGFAARLAGHFEALADARVLLPLIAGGARNSGPTVE